MDLLVMQRAPIRSSFTKAYNNLKKNLAVEEPKLEVIQVHMANIERLSKNLEVLDGKICEILLQDITLADKYNSEYESIEEYREKLTEAQVAMEMFVNKLNKAVLEPDVLVKKTKLKLPKIEFLKFGGDVKDWLAFWSQFSRIHNDSEMDSEDKFQYLIQSLVPSSRAREIVESFPPTAENYEKAVEALKGRFGREELLIEFYVRELLGLVIKNAMLMKTKLNTAQLYDRLESHLRALESIGMTSDKYAAMLFPLVESCIPEEILRVWLRSPIVVKEDQNSYNEKLKNLLLFLRTEVESEERISLAKTGFKQERNPKVENIKGNVPVVPTANELLIGSKPIEDINCVFCEKNHKVENCFKAQKMPVSEKLELLKQKKCCFTCLRVGHRSKFCKKSNIRCMVCSKRHLIVMCPEIAKKNSESEMNNTLYNQCYSEVYLQTLLVRLSFQGKEKTVRVLVDTGSQRSYILDSTIQEMGFKPLYSEMLTQVVFGGVTARKEHSSYNVCLKSLHNDYSINIQALNQPVICGSIPRLNNKLCFERAKKMGIQLTDVGFGQPPIEILIGSDFAGKIYTGIINELADGLFAVQTCLGWMIMGKTLGKSEQESYGSALTSLLIHSSDVTNLWSLESIGITDPVETQSKEEMECAVETHFKETIFVNEEGRYSVSLPWVYDPEELPTNFEVAEKRLISTTNKLRNLEKFNIYDKSFESWKEDGVITECSMEGGHFLAHRGVFKSHSTTPVRPVFDASCKQKGQLSLNDCLAKGPNLLEKIPSILFKFREKKIGVISDIKKAFLQISVHTKDRHFLKFLWWEKEDQALKAFQHCRVVFGLNCSPFLLGAVIKHHLDQYSDSVLADTTKKLKEAFYVDNCVTSVDTEEDLKRFIQLSSHVMNAAKFDLRGWEHTSLPSNSIKSDPIPVLGILWDKDADLLFCNVSQVKKPEGPLTRRCIFSIIHKIFDPLGVICPVMLYPKLLLQQSWKSKLSWDTEVPEEISRTFLKWFDELQFLTEVKIPRGVSLCISSKISLHTFCDASATSYAAAVFLCCETEQNTSVQLLIAKSRIAPLKKTSIPRLELMACCIGVRLIHFIKNNLQGYDFKEYYWTDSSTALYWITHDEPWTVLVKNRVDEIRKLTNPKNWRHVPGKENPADLPSRGCTVTKLIKSRWWEGPLWLKLEKKDWPHSKLSAEEDEILSEKRSNVMISGIENSWLVSYFSIFSKIVRMVGWILRFIHNANKSKVMKLAGPLSQDELKDAEFRVFRIVQHESFVSNDLRRLKSLSVFEDEAGVLRVKTKLTERKDEEEFKYPVLLPSRHKLVELLIREMHLRNLHAGVHILMSALREKYWILSGRRTISRVISQCVKCKRFVANPFETVPVSLPENRVRDACIFEVVGVDLAGPLILRNGEKTWIVLYTCAVFRAIHLELVTSLSTKTFLLSLRRFIARRGRPSVIYSDNGTNFVGAENLFQTINWSEVETEATAKRITWIFNPPSAAWWGGFWERLIQMVKKLLRRILGNASLSYEELITILCDVESTVNSRPLTYVTEDPNALIPLTPAMFLQHIPTVGVPDLDRLGSVDLNKRLKYQQSLREHLRRRFRLEYLGQLVLSGSQAKTRTVEVGEIVLIESVDKARTFWPMAKVIKIYPGKDGAIRVVKLKTSTGELIRPVRRIYPLEIQSPHERLQINKKTDKQRETGKVNDFRKDLSNEVAKPTDLRTKSGRQVRIPSKLQDFELLP